MDASVRLHRSELAVPGSNVRMLEKAPSLGADVVMLDLEDAVAPADKVQARSNVIEALRELDWGGASVSLRINGLEPGVNDRAMERRIVVHGADYVSPNIIAEHGRLGRSWGCLALSRDVASAVIDRIKGGSAVFAYYPDPWWMQTSQFLRCDGSWMARR